MGSEEIEKEKSQSGIGKMIAKALCSHLGLCIIVIAYCVIGGLLFEMLEKENEVNACVEARDEYMDMENDTLFSLLDVILSNPLGSHAADVQMLGVFESFRNNSLSIGYDGSWCEGYGLSDGPAHEWNFAGGIFFSMTVITTIGYGHIAPKTQWGRILLLPYSLIGIPIMLIFLANVGDILADIFKYIYAKIICCGCMRARKKKKPSNRPQNNNTNKNQSQGGVRAGIPDTQGNFQRIGSSSSNRSTASSNAPLMAQEPGSPIGNTSDVKQRSNAGNPLNIKALGSSDLAERGRLMRMNTSQQPLIVDDDSDDDDDEDDWEEINKVAVPLTISLGIIGLYIMGGAILFHYWEGWDMSQSGYFCFITLSTIGFGDITPGRDFSDPTANARLIIGSVYSIFGMAILSMCFTLMQEEMLAKFNWIGRKMGVVETEEEEPLMEPNPRHVDKNSSDC